MIRRAIRPLLRITAAGMASTSGDGGKMKQDPGLSTKNPKQVSEEEWKKVLSPTEYHVTREAGTEPPYSGKYDKHLKPGQYNCICCGEPLFVSDTKFDSGCGWPAFWAAEKGADGAETVTRITDDSLGMRRVEVRCKKCNAHLGHVFEDGPADKTGERFCINSVSINFEPKKK